MSTNQPAQQESQDDISARLALISKAVQEKLAGRQQGPAVKQVAAEEQALLVANTCPVDPMERLLCEGCQ